MKSVRFVVAGLLSIFPIIALGQEVAPVAIGVASAVSYAPIPPNTPFDVVAQDSTGLNARTLERVKNILVGRQHTISADAPYVMIVDMALIRAIDQDLRQDAPNVGTDAPLGQGDNVFSTERSTLLNRREVPRSGHLLRLNISVYDRATGLYVWRGQVSRDGLDVRIEDATEHMIAVLLENLGKSLPEQEIPLQ